MKTLIEIQNEIQSAKDNTVALSGLTSTSKVSIWGALRDVFAFLIWTLYNFFDEYMIEVRSAANTGYFGTLAWWIDNAKKFQFGYELELIDNRFVYSTEDSAAQVVKHVAVSVINKSLIIKTANEDSNAQPIALTDEQIIALTAYLNKIKPVGTLLLVTSGSADKINVEYKIYYNAEYELSAMKAQISEVLNNYVRTIVFNGKFSVTECTTAVQAIDGVVSPIFISANGRTATAPLADAVEFIEFYNSTAGYMSIETVTLTMVPYAV